MLAPLDAADDLAYAADTPGNLSTPVPRPLTDLFPPRYTFCVVQVLSDANRALLELVWTALDGSSVALVLTVSWT